MSLSFGDPLSAYENNAIAGEGPELADAATAALERAKAIGRRSFAG
jgi:hypothetical protein